MPDESIPFWNGRGLNYHQAFLLAALIYTWFALIATFVVWLLIAIYVYCRKKKLKNNELQSPKDKQSYDTLSDISNNNQEKLVNPVQEQSKIISTQPQQTSKLIYILEIINNVLMWLMAVLVSLNIVLAGGFQFINTISTILLLDVLFFLLIIYQANCYHTICQENVVVVRQLFHNMKKSYSKHYIAYGILTGVLLFLAQFIPLISTNICLCVYNTGYGIQVTSSIELSSEYTRKFWIGSHACDQYSLCHLYATIPQNGSNSVFITMHTGVNINSMIVQYQDYQSYINKQDNFIIVEAQQQQITGIEKRGQRNVFTAYLSNLQPNTKYYIKVQDTNNHISRQTTYVTLPNFGDNQPINIAFGGDVGNTDIGKNLTNLLKNYNISAIIVGGDLAYDDNFITCYFSWDTFLDLFENLFNETGQIYPLIMSMGNHDIGFNALSGVNISGVSSDGPFYFTYFPQQLGSNQGIPAYSERTTYHYHLLGNMIHFCLDSGYVQSFGGPQSQWLSDTATKFPNYYKYANYHVPIYPSCYDADSIMTNPQTITDSKKYWTPLFDKFNFLGSFENHEHQLKRTVPLTNDQQNDQNGVIYFGDGNWGVFISQCEEQYQMNRIYNYFALADNYNSSHIWILQMNPGNNTVSYFAFDNYNNIIPNSFVSQNISKYFNNQM